MLGFYKAMAKVLGFAFKHRMIQFNPCVAVRRPRADTQEARFLSVEEVGTLAVRLSSQPPYDLLVRFAALTGLRGGEIAALRIRDLDLLHGEVRVRRTMTHTSAGYVTGVLKTARSVRDVPILDDGLWADLRSHLAQHPHGDDPDAGLWPGKIPGHANVSYGYSFDPKGFYRHTFKPAARRAGFAELKMHELRHTFATLALESGQIDMFELSPSHGPRQLHGHRSRLRSPPAQGLQPSAGGLLGFRVRKRRRALDAPRGALGDARGPGFRRDDGFDEHGLGPRGRRTGPRSDDLEIRHGHAS